MTGYLMDILKMPYMQRLESREQLGIVILTAYEDCTLEVI